MLKFVIIIIIFSLISCNKPEIPVDWYTKCLNESQEADNLEVSNKFEALEPQIYVDTMEFVSSWNTGNNKFYIQLMPYKQYKVWKISSNNMKRLYLENSIPTFDINAMVSFCWQERGLIILSRNSAEDFYHELGHAFFPNGGEGVAEAFMNWCVKKDYTK